MPLSHNINSDKPAPKDASPDGSIATVSNTEIAVDLGKSFLQSALISPVWNGVGQLVSAGSLPQVSIVNEENAKRSEADAWAQKIGSGAGMAVDLFAMTLLAKKMSPKTAEAGAQTLGLGQRSLQRGYDGFKLGATYGAAFVPSQPDDNLIWGRAKNALNNGVNFAFMSGLAEAAGGVSILGKIKTGSLAHSAKEIAVTGAVGLPSGAVGAEVDSLINHGRLAGWKEIKEQATDNGVIGTVFATLSHGAAIGARPTMRATALNASPEIAPVNTPAAKPPVLASEPLHTAPVEHSYPILQSPPSEHSAPVEHSTPIEQTAHEHSNDAPVQPKAATNFSTDPRELLAQDRGNPLKSETFDTLGSTAVRHEFADGTVVTEHVYPPTKITELPDKTIITESDGGIRTDFPDGSEINITAYRTERRSADGAWSFESNHWADTWENWETASEADKIKALSTIEEIPRGGNLVANLIQKGLAEPNQAVQELAVNAIGKVPDAAELANQWNLAREYNEHFAPQLNDMLPNLKREARQELLSGSEYRIENILADLAARHDTLPEAQAKELARSEYLNMIQDFSRQARKQLWGFFGDVLDAKTPTGKHSGPLLRELAEQVRQEAQQPGTGAARAAFAEFSNHPEARFRPIERTQRASVTRSDIDVKPLPPDDATFSKVRSILTKADAQAKLSPDGARALNEARAEASRLLDGDSSIALKKMFFDWAQKERSEWIKNFAEWQLSAPKRFVELTNELIRLSRKDPLSQFHEKLAMSSVFDLSKRAPEYNINRAQVEATLQNSVELMQIADANRGPNGELTRAGNQFRMAALQTMAQAADPYLIVQGFHPTCSLAQIEFSTFMKHPDEASRLINEVMRTGNFVTTDGTMITIDAGSMRPEPGSLEFNRTRYDKKDPKYRSYASQIFQTTAANIHWQRQTIEPDLGTTVPVGSLRYEIHQVSGWDHVNNKQLPDQWKDRLMNYSRKKPTIVAESPDMGEISQFLDIGHQIGGRRTEPSVSLSLPNDVTQFENYIRSLPYPESFPLIVGIDADALVNRSKAFDQPNHAVSIVSPHQTGRRIYFHNTWFAGGLLDNHLERDRFWSISWR